MLWAASVCWRLGCTRPTQALSRGRNSSQHGGRHNQTAGRPPLLWSSGCVRLVWFLQQKRDTRSFKEPRTFWPTARLTLYQKIPMFSWGPASRLNAAFSTSKLEVAATATAILCPAVSIVRSAGDDVAVGAHPTVSYRNKRSLNKQKIFSIKLHSHFFFHLTDGWKSTRFCPVWLRLVQPAPEPPALSVNHHRSDPDNWQSVWFPWRRCSGGVGVGGQMCRGHHAPSRAAMLIPLRSPKSSPSPSQYSPSSSWSSKRVV